jgi:NADH-quinone oxidoreductase subunit J
MQTLLPAVIFYIFAGMTVISSAALVLQNNPMKSVLLLVFSFICSAVLWLLLQTEFLALILILVYVGAVMTLFLFVIMMLNIDTELMRRPLLRYIPLAALIMALLLGFLWQVKPAHWMSVFSPLDQTSQSISNTELLGSVLYTDYVLAFELAAVILLVAMVAAVTLVQRQRYQSKHQSVVQQIMTKKNQRLRLVSIDSEKDIKE